MPRRDLGKSSRPRRSHDKTPGTISPRHLGRRSFRLVRSLVGQLFFFRGGGRANTGQQVCCDDDSRKLGWLFCHHQPERRPSRATLHWRAPMQVALLNRRARPGHVCFGNGILGWSFAAERRPWARLLVREGADQIRGCLGRRAFPPAVPAQARHGPATSSGFSSLLPSLAFGGRGKGRGRQFTSHELCTSLERVRGCFRLHLRVKLVHPGSNPRHGLSD